MELSKEQMKLVIAKLEGSYNSKTFADENLQEIINLFKIISMEGRLNEKIICI